MATFDLDVLIRFAHCDPAGIVFFPRYFEMVNQTVEDWFAGPLGRSFKALHMDGGVGVPTARFETEFRKPSRLGDVVRFSLEVEQIERSSCILQIQARCGDELRAWFRQTIVFVDLATMKSAPWPDDLRARISAFAAESPETESPDTAPREEAE
jgi:4-hydroxybenzoyl-CoA thioesterase